MTRLTKQSDAVRPSAPDPVDAWLDVLVAMLAIPKPDRQRVRDELEDHLRSRIDDLLIHGLTEPQALQKAVAELGETADLARQLSHAHKPPRTRRYAMHALLIALTGTVVALGVNTVRPSAPTTGTVAFAAAEPVVLANLEVRDKTIGEVLESYRSHTDRPVVIHWSALADIGLHREEPIGIDSGPLAVSVVFEILAERTRGIDAIERFESPEAIEVGPRSLFDRRTISRRNYELSGVKIPGLSFEDASTQRAESAVSSLMYAIRNHVSRNDWTDEGGDLATMSPVGTSIVVSAPQRMHDEIEALLADLHEQGVAAEMAQDQAESDRRRAELRMHDELIDQLKQEYARASLSYLGAMSELNRLRRERNELMVQPAQRTQDEKDLGPHLDQIDAGIRARELEAEEHNARVRYLRSRLIAGEYEYLFSELPAPVPHADPASAPSDPG